MRLATALGRFTRFFQQFVDFLLRPVAPVLAGVFEQEVLEQVALFGVLVAALVFGSGMRSG